MIPIYLMAIGSGHMTPRAPSHILLLASAGEHSPESDILGATRYAYLEDRLSFLRLVVCCVGRSRGSGDSLCIRPNRRCESRDSSCDFVDPTFSLLRSRSVWNSQENF